MRVRMTLYAMNQSRTREQCYYSYNVVLQYWSKALLTAH
jgi:hypothetical protein